MKLATTMDEEYSYSLHMLGTATTLYRDDPEDAGDRAVRDLRAVVEEVTGKPVDKPARPRMGFL
jgi:hypothetical protein